MAHSIQIDARRRALARIAAATCLLAAGFACLPGAAQAAFHGGGGHYGGGHAFGHGGFHGGYHGGYGGWHHGGGFVRGGHYWYYGPNGVLLEEYGYVPQVIVPAPYFAAPFGVIVP